jgi:hypothetical protein
VVLANTLTIGHTIYLIKELMNLKKIGSRSVLFLAIAMILEIRNMEKDPLMQLNKTVEELCNMMGVIKRDYDLEKKYTKLRSIADQYNKELSKYRTFESLKEDSNGS